MYGSGNRGGETSADSATITIQTHAADSNEAAATITGVMYGSGN